MHDLYQKEMALRGEGYTYIAGVDEAGRGPLAGPVVAGAVILPIHSNICDLKDSKLLSEKKRQKVYEEIKNTALSYAYAVVDESYIDTYNILNATYIAMKEAVGKLSITPDFVLVDALKIPDINIPQQSIIKGDRLCACIAAASIIAKVERDRIMCAYSKEYPQYDFIRNKGYATKKHMESLKKYGRCPIHRKSFNVKGLNT
ncbi:MAG: ribonuclease HII [Tepidanaerobacteraceae bacterium]